MCIPGVANACALLDEAAGQIVLFAESGEKLTLRQANKVLKQYIPAYMLPGRLVVMERLPHTANDKIDRVRLRASLTEEVAPC